MSDLGGVWRTVGGRRIFIKDGEDLATAMKRSGKFNSKKGLTKDGIKKLKELEKDEEFQKEFNEFLKDAATKEETFKPKAVGSKTFEEHGEKPAFTDKEKSESFIQKTDMYGGTREYSKEQLDKMEQHGAKPMEHSYTGGGWEGTKYDSNLSTKDIAKNIADYSKKEFPDVKLSRKTDYNGIDIHVVGSEKDLYASSKDIDMMNDSQVSDTIRNSIGGISRLDDWLNDNNRKSSNGTYTTNDMRDYLKEELNTYKNRNGYNATGNEWYLSDYGKEVISGLNKEMNSYNFDDSDGMVDYFHTNFYGRVMIGKWDKPYEVSQGKSNSSSSQKAYQKYLDEHPLSDMSFADFKEMNGE